MKSDITDVEVQLHHETGAAYLVSTDGDSDKAVWVPKSKCEFERNEGNRRIGTLTLPEWLATEKGLV